MSLMDRFMTRARLRRARQQLADDPSASNYVALAEEHARAGELEAAQRVCDEGLALFPNHTELNRLSRRSQQLELGGRVRELARELRDGPSAERYEEICELLLSSGRAERADEYALEWHAASNDVEALVMRARARLECYRIGRGRDDGRLAWDLCEEVARELDADERPYQLQFELASMVGAWNEALTATTRLLELSPGDEELEARYRSLQARADERHSFAMALREVEKTGLFADELEDSQPEGSGPSNSAVRAMLKEISTDPDVHAALYVRGNTALIQGPRGPTAERTARMVRESVQLSRVAARKMGLGQALEVSVEGPFGSLLLLPGSAGSGAVWRTGPTWGGDRRRIQQVLGSRPSESRRRSR